MKVVYKKPITDKMYEAVLEAARQNKDVEKFILTKEEWSELNRILINPLSSSLRGVENGVTLGSYYGIPIEVEC